MGGDGIIIEGAGHTINGSNNNGVIIDEAQAFTLSDTTVEGFASSDLNHRFADNKGTMTIGEHTTFNFNQSKDSQGGVIKNSGTLNILGGEKAQRVTFNSNQANSGGAVYNEKNAQLEISQSKFSGNQAQNGGAVYNKGTITLLGDDGNDDPFGDNDVDDPFGDVDLGRLAGDEAFVPINEYSSNKADKNGGAVYNDGIASTTLGSFTANEAGENGGAFYNTSSVESISTGYHDNLANENGGAIYSTFNLHLTANDGTMQFKGNTANGKSNAIYMANQKELELNVNENGIIKFDDGINGAQGYTIAVNGKGKATALNSGVIFNNTVENAGQITVKESNLTLAEQGNIDGSNLKLDSSLLNLGDNSTNQVLDLAGFSAENNSSIVFDANLGTGASDSINAATANGSIALDAINILDDGNNDITLFSNGFVDFTNLDSFAASSDLYIYKFTAENGKLVIAEKTAAYMGLNSAAFEQTRNLVRNVVEKTSATVALYDRCNGLYDWAYDNKPLHNLWVSPVYGYANLNAPVDLDADVYGLEAGVKFEKLIESDNGYNKVYIKPSVIQTFVDGDRIQMSGINELDTMKDMTLGKAEIGFSASIGNNLTAFGAAYYVYGKDYDAASVNVGLNYAF